MVIQAEHAAAEQFYVSISDEEFWEAVSGPSRVMKHGSGVMGPDNKLNLYRWRGGGSLQSSNGHFIIHVLCSQWVTCGPVVPTPCHPDMDQACLSHVPKLFIIIKEILAIS